MGKGDRLPNEGLLAAALDVMRRNGQPLTKLSGYGRSMMYKLPNDEHVRVRTCNDHLLIVLADSTAENAGLNIEGTEWLLIAMPEVERTPGNVLVYLVPTEVVAEAARESHKAWLKTNPNTKGGNTTWNLWFRTDGTEKPHNNFGHKWKKYLLNGVGSVSHPLVGGDGTGATDVKTEVEAARQRISKAAGVLPEAVKIAIDFGH